MSIFFQPIDSRSELLQRLKIGVCSVLVGDDDEATREFYIGAIPSCTIGVCSQGHGIKPSSFLDDSKCEGWIGFNCKVANIDLRKCERRFVVILDGVFYSIVSQVQDGSVVVVHELGACRISRAGELLWNCTTDVVLDFADRGNRLWLRTDDGEITVEKERGTRA